MIKSYINGIESILFYEERVSIETAPMGYPYMYHLRHDDNNWIQPVTIESFVVVNFFGTVFMKESVEIGDDGYVEVESFVHQPSILSS